MFSPGGFHFGPNGAFQSLGLHHFLRRDPEPVGFDSRPGKNADDDEDPNPNLGLAVHVRCLLAVICRSIGLSTRTARELSGEPGYAPAKWASDRRADKNSVKEGKWLLTFPGPDRTKAAQGGPVSFQPIRRVAGPQRVG